MDNPKQTMFLIPPGTPWPNGSKLNELIPQGIMPNVAQSFDAAKVIIDMGISIAVMYPFSIPWDAYTFQDKKMDPIYGSGYCFWEQELKEKEIPTIVVDLGIIGGDRFLYLKSQAWRDNNLVRFFRYHDLAPNWDDLVTLIKSF